MGQLLALCYAIFMGVGNVYARKGMEDCKIDRFSGIFVTLVINNCLNFILLFIYFLIYGSFSLNFPGVIYNVTAGLLNSFTGRWALFYSMSYIGASRAGILKVITPLFAIFGGVFLLKEVITLQAWLGIIVVLGGVILISIEAKEKEGRLAINRFVGASTTERKVITVKGIILGILASLFFAGGNVCRKISVSYIPNPLLGVSIGSLVALLSSIIVQLARGKGYELIDSLKSINKSYLFSGISNSLALYSLFWSLELTSISIASSIGASEALFTIFASMALLGKKEILNWRVVTGALIVIVGVVLLITM
ncbi:MAG: DMT family transporter [Firmicutes bacterium]|nr:DMT family transporter [Bacillota bacterium]